MEDETYTVKKITFETIQSEWFLNQSCEVKPLFPHI